MSAIVKDWTDDYDAGDSTLPGQTTPIPFPADGTTDVGFIIRETKAGVREYSNGRGWQIEELTVTWLTSTTFKVATDYRALIPTGTAVRIVLAASTVYSWVIALSWDGADTTLTIADAVATNPITTVTFSAVLPQGSHARSLAGYTDDVGSVFPTRVTQRGEFFFTGGSPTTMTVPLLLEEYDANYKVLVQAVATSGASALGAYRILKITPATDGFEIEFDNDPGGSVVNTYEYVVVRGT